MDQAKRSTDAAANALQSDAGQGNAPAWLVGLAKAGYFARGIIYVIIGALALLQAFGRGGESTDSKGAIGKVLEAPGGVVLLWLIGIGLLGYAVWRFCQSALDADRHGKDGKGLAVRAGLMVSAITHTLLAFYTFSIALNVGGGSEGGSSSEDLVARMLGWPGGQWIVGLVGLCIIGVAAAHARKAGKEKYKKHLKIEPSKMSAVNPICKFGLYARGVAFLIVGGMFLYAAITQDPDEAGGMREVLTTISQQAFGMILLGIMGAGLFAFGLYSMVEGIYRKIDGPTD